MAYPFSRDRVLLQLEGDEPLLARARVEPGGAVDLEVAGVRRRYEVHAVDDVIYVDSPLGHSALRERPAIATGEDEAETGSLRAPLPGRILRVAADAGSEVEAGTILVVLEAMKMEHQVLAPRRGRVAEVRVREGQQVDAGTVLAVLAEEA